MFRGESKKTHYKNGACEGAKSEKDLRRGREEEEYILK